MMTTPMKRLFDRLRQRKKEAEDQIAALEQKVQELDRLEAKLVERHLDPTLESALNFFAKEFVGEPEQPIEEAEEEKEKERLGPAAAVRQLFPTPDINMTAREVRDSLEDMRQQGLIETTATKFDSDRTNKILRALRGQGFLKRVEVEEGGILVKAYTRDIEVGAEEEELIEKVEQKRLGLTAAVRQLFVDSTMSMTALEIRDRLEDMRQQGLLETKATQINSDLTHSTLRGLLDQKFLVKLDPTKEGCYLYVKPAKRSVLGAQVVSPQD